MPSRCATSTTFDGPTVAGAVAQRRRVRLVPRVGPDAGLERRREHERLERAARLPVALVREVELFGVELPAAHHRLDGARLRIDRDERGVRVPRLIEHRRHGVLRVLLELAVERRRDLEPAAIEEARALGFGRPERGVREHLLLHELNEVRVVERAERWAALRQTDRLSGRRLLLCAVDHAFLAHPSEDVVATHERGLRLVEGVHAPRGPDQAGQERGLCQRQLHRRRAEVGLCRSRDPVRARAEVRAVEVHREDLVLVVLALETQRDAGLSELHFEGALAVREVHELRELLRDRGTALDGLALRPVRQRGARDRLGVDAGVLPEARVLDGDDGILDHLWDVGRRDRRAVLLEQRCEQRSVRGSDLGAEGQRLLFLLGQRPEQRRAAGAGERQDDEQETPMYHRAPPSETSRSGKMIILVDRDRVVLVTFGVLAPS
jgi:hypothetical protein